MSKLVEKWRKEYCCSINLHPKGGGIGFMVWRMSMDKKKGFEINEKDCPKLF